MVISNILKARIVFLITVIISIVLTENSYSKNISVVNFEDIKTGSLGHKARIILKFDKKLEYKIFFLKDPSRLVIDTQNINVKFYREFAELDTNFIRHMRFGKINEKINRIVFDLAVPIVMKSISETTKKDGTGLQVILDLYYAKKIEPSKKLFQTKGWGKYVGNQKKEQEKKLNITKNEFIKNRKYTIVIDPGHGGIDPGAVRGKTYEKDIALRISKILADDLKNIGIFNIYLTRNDDRFIPLKERYEIAENLNAMLFISVHADTNPNTNLSGSSIYTLSKIGKNSQFSKIEERNNKSYEIEFDNYDNKETTNSYIATLSKMAFNTKNRRSEIFAKEVVKSLKRTRIKTLKTAHRKANFHVLKSFKVPSILVETGYMSNKYDLANLKNYKWIQKFSRSISYSILNYLQVTKR